MTRRDKIRCNGVSRLFLTILGVGFVLFSTAYADSVPDGPSFGTYSNPESVILAVSAPFAKINGNIRVTVYDNKTSFLETASAKFQGTINGDGIAVVDLGPLTPGEYAFVAYYDENRDGKLNRGPIGIPREPYAFSNSIKPRFSKPKFEETSVTVNTGSVVIIELED